ncbi:MAG: undecaprenyldiphospho-muramoylpentapeptide beta-N-acetylglucosaminyltransferase [Treponema sp.]|nr:undecaprenyldiphospho-muramoylpentapeptide beta-N-acetylglucosaminyltransferase [Treponema sp.]
MISIAFTGGGTGGHIYPGLAIASWMEKLLPCRLFWIGSSTGMDRAIVEGAGMEFYGIPSGKLRRYFSLRNFFDIFRVAAGFFAARRILKREAPALLFSKGGFVSVPPCAAARSLGIPVYAHESDYSPGLATRINSRFAEKIFLPYAESAAFFHGKAGDKLTVSGNPIRTEFAAADGSKGRAFLGLGLYERILLVLGGSQGSRELNELVWACLPELTGHYTVVHQTGENSAAEASQKSSQRYRPYAYFAEEIPHVIAAAELVLCRSGAGTIWECKSLNKPMVLIPLRSGASRGDQLENAELFEKAGAAVCFIPEAGGEEAAHSKLSALICSLAGDSGKLKLMAQAKIGRPDAAAFIAEETLRRIVDKGEE